MRWQRGVPAGAQGLWAHVTSAWGLAVCRDRGNTHPKTQPTSLDSGHGGPFNTILCPLPPGSVQAYGSAPCRGAGSASWSSRGQLLAFFGVHFAGDTNRTLPLEVLGPSPRPPVCLSDICIIPVPAMLASFQAQSPGTWSSSLWPPNVPSLPSHSPCRPDHAILSCPGFLESPQPPQTLRMAAPPQDPDSQMIRGPERSTRIAGSDSMQSVPAFQRVGPLIPLYGHVGEGARAREARQLASNGVVSRLVQLPL